MHLQGATMGTTYNVKYVGRAATAADVSRAVDAVLDQVNRTFSTYLEDSEVSRFNAWRASEPFPASALFTEVLREALELAAASGGAFDPTVMPVTRLYRFSTEGERREPSPEELAAARAKVGFRQLEIAADGEVVKRRSDLELDLNAIAKGKGVDLVAAELERLGQRRYMVEVGGEVRCAGRKPGDQPWQVGIEKPDPQGSERLVQEVLPLVDRAVATSGSYRNWFESGGRRIYHIVDARTGVNAPGAAVSVSVTAPDCALADGLATALMIVGPEGTEAVLAAYPGVDLRVLFLLRGEGGGIEQRGFRWP